MRWPPYHQIFFDCDSTLTTVEGIEVLARSAGKGWRVEVLTRAAMDGDVDLEEVYAKRLRAVRPTRGQIYAIRQVYKRNIVEDAAAVIAALQFLGHHVYIISGGLAEPVIEFGIYLGVPRENICAVDVEYDKLSSAWWESYAEKSREDRYLDFQAGALTISDGKAHIVRQLRGQQPGRALLLGDGTSDLLASRAVDLFVGYGGVTTRPPVLANAPAFVHSGSLAPILALASGPAGLKLLEPTPHQALVEKTRHLIEEGAITFQNERLGEKFNEAYQTIYSRSH